MTRAPTHFRDRERPTPRPILVCEDDAVLARIITRNVEQWTRSRPLKLVAADGALVARMAVEAIADHDPALVVTDGLDGGVFEVAQACAEKGVPCIVFTGEARRFAQCGAAVIEKPEMGALEAAVRRALAKEAA